MFDYKAPVFTTKGVSPNRHIYLLKKDFLGVLKRSPLGILSIHAFYGWPGMSEFESFLTYWAAVIPLLPGAFPIAKPKVRTHLAYVLLASLNDFIQGTLNSDVHKCERNELRRDVRLKGRWFESDKLFNDIVDEFSNAGLLNKDGS